MLWWFFLFLLELLDLSADLFYTAATITGILLARPSFASFYTSLHLLQYFSLLLAFPIHLFYSKNTAKMPIAHLLHLFIHACIFYNSSSYWLKPTRHPWRPFCHNMHLQAINITDHLRKCICSHKTSSKSAILMLFIWHKFQTEGKNSGSSIIHPRWFLFPQKLLIYPPHTLL